MIKIQCDDCGKDIHGTHIYFRGKNRCWKCDGKLDANHNLNEKEKGE